MCVPAVTQIMAVYGPIHDMNVLRYSEAVSTALFNIDILFNSVQKSIIIAMVE